MLSGELLFEVSQVTRGDLLSGGHKSVKLLGYVSLDLQLLEVVGGGREGVLAEEVADQDIFDVGLLVLESSAARIVHAAHCLVAARICRLPQIEGLDGVHA